MVASAQLIDPLPRALPGGLGAVAEDMEAILARIPATPAPLPRRPVRRSIGRSRRWMIAAASVAMVCAGVLAERLSDPTAVPATPKIAQAADLPAPLAVPPPAPPVAAAVAAAPTRIDAVPTVRTGYAVAIAHHRNRRSPAFARNEHKPAKGCRGGEAWCLRNQVQAAARALRDAYADAADAGVRYRTMAAVRHDWSRLRRLSDDDPRTLIRGYNILAQQLRAEAGL